MPKIRLNDIVVNALKPPPKGQVTYWDATLPSFGLRVSQGGTKTFVLVYGEARTRQTLGRYPIISLADARTEAKRILAQLTLGTHTTPTITFAEGLATFLANTEKRNKPRTAKDYRRLLHRHFLPTLGKKKLGDITPHDITRIIDDLLATPSECAHAFAAIKIFFRWAIRRHLTKTNPADGLQGPPKSASRERVLTDAELRHVLVHARQKGFPFGHVLQLLILTGQRRSEIGSLEWNWIDTDTRTITLPASVTKNRREHAFPYGDMVAATLNGIDRRGRFLFPGSKDAHLPITGWSNFKAAFDKKCKVESWTLHDLRRTFATNLAALGVRLEVTEKLLNHVSGSFGGIVGVYQRHGFQEEMRAAVLAWEARITTLLDQPHDRA
ncbi:MAG: site-specific integrase [Methylocystis sp.]